MKKYIISILMLYVFNCHSQISNELKIFTKPFDNVRSFNVMDFKNDSISTLLEKKATENELVFLSLKGRSIYIKGIAISTLISKKSNQIFNIFDYYIDSNERASYSTECLYSDSSFPFYIFEALIFNKKYSDIERNKNKEILVRKILSKDLININLLEEIYYQIPINEEFYNPIRKIVINERSPTLLVTIAKFKKHQDIKLIKSFGNKAYAAIEEFPNREFIEILEKEILYNEYQYMFALSATCFPESIHIAKKAIQLKVKELKTAKCGNKCLNTIYNQIEMNSCELFYPVLENLWLTNKIVSYNIYNNYKENHSKKEIENFLLKGLMLKGEAEIIQNNSYDTEIPFDQIDLKWNNEAKLVHMLHELKKYSHKGYLQALKNNIIEIDDLGLPNFVGELNDKESLLLIKKSFLEKMTFNESAYGLLIIMEAIQLIDDTETFQRGFEIIKLRKDEFKKYPIWEEELDIFLKKYNLTLE